MHKHAKGSRGSTSSDTSPSTSSLHILRTCKCHLQDAIIIALAVIIFFACLVASLISYYVVQNQDYAKVFSTLSAARQVTVDLVQQELTDAFRKLQPLSSTVQYTAAPLNYKSQFLPIMDSGYPQYVEAVMYCDRVSASDATAYTNNMKSQGGYYSNFAIHSGDQPYSTSTTLNAADEYYPVTLSVGVDYFTKSIGPQFNRSKEIAFLGWDLATVANKDAVNIVNATLKPAVGDVQLKLGGSPNGIQLFQNSTVAALIPIVDASGNRLKGVFAGIFGVEEILTSVVSGLDNIIVTLIDNNKTAINGGLLYNSLFYANINDIQKVRDSARYNTAQNFTVLNKQYQLIFTSTEDYVNKNAAINRWSGSIIAIVLFIILEGFCLALFFFLRLRLSLRERKNSKRAINALKDGHERTKLLLHRLAKQEAKARATVDAVPFFVIILNSVGRILHTNKNFDKTFGYSESQLQQGLHITAVIPSFTANIFCEPKYSSDEGDVYIRAIATSNQSQDVDVRCVVKNLFSSGLSRMGSGSSVGTPITPMTPMSPDFTDEAGEEDEAFAVIGTTVSNELQDSFDLRKKNVNML
jgi:PAS domain-containing protein